MKFFLYFYKFWSILGLLIFFFQNIRQYIWYIRKIQVPIYPWLPIFLSLVLSNSHEMNLQPWWQLNFIGHLANLPKYGEGFLIPPHKALIHRPQQFELLRKELDKHHVPNLILRVTSLLVSPLLYFLSGLDQVWASYIDLLVPPLSKLKSRHNSPRIAHH